MLRLFRHMCASFIAMEIVPNVFREKRSDEAIQKGAYRARGSGLLRFARRTVAASMVLVAAPLYAASDAPTHGIQEIKVAGVSAWLMEDDTLPLVTLRLRIEGAGTASDVPELAGRAAMAARLLTEGAGEYDAAGFTHALQEKAIRLGAGVSKDAFSVQLKTTKYGLKEAFRLMGLALTQANFAEGDVSRIREEMLAQLRSAESSPHYHAGLGMRALLYGNHPYANLPYGSAESLAALNSEALRAYAQRYLTKDKVVMSVVGDISADELSALLEEHLGAMPEIAQPEAVIEKVKLAPARVFSAKEMDVPQSAIVFATGGIARNHPDFYAAYLLNYMVGGSGLTSLLGQAVRQEEGLSYSINTGLSNDAQTSLWQGGTSTRTDGVVKALEIIDETLAEIAEKGVSEEDFLRAKAYVTGSFALALDNTETFAAYLQLMQEDALGMDYLEKRNSYFDAVSHADVQRVARKLLSRPRYTVVVGKGVERQVKQLAE